MNFQIPGISHQRTDEKIQRPDVSMNVMHVIIGLGIGGAELMLQRLVTAQRGSCVISLTDLGPVGHMLRSVGVEVIALDSRGGWDLPRVFFSLFRLIRARRPKVVQTWMVHADLLGGLAARLAGIKAVIWGIRTTDFQSSSFVTRQMRWMCARLSRLIPASIACAAEASRRSHSELGYDTSRMVVIPNGFDIERFKPDALRRSQVRGGLGISEADIVIGHVGRWNDDKDHANFVRAAAKLHLVWDNGHPSKCLFVMVGREVDGQNQELDKSIALSGCRDRFLLLGERGDVHALLQAFDLFCLSSRTEGFPNVVGEAMSSGVPCVVTDVGDAAILVGDTGWVVPKEDSGALAAALEEGAIEAASLHKARAMRARQRIVDEFSMARACQRFAELQERVARDHRQSAGNK